MRQTTVAFVNYFFAPFRAQNITRFRNEKTHKAAALSYPVQLRDAINKNRDSTA